MRSDWLPFGVLRRPHGTKGEILLHPYHDAALRSDSSVVVSRVRLRGSGAEREAYVLTARPVREGFLVRFEGITEREAIAALVGHEVHLPRRSLAAPGASEFFVEDIVGCEVRRPDGHRLGQIGGTFWNGAQDVMIVAGEDGAEHLFPVVAEYVLRFDDGQRLLVVDPHE